MAFTVAKLVDLLDLRDAGRDRFAGLSPEAGWQRIFGGLVVAQALVAASRTVEDRGPHALHAFFLRPGDPAAPVEYEVARLRDGRSFATRHCAAMQGGAMILTMTASFQAEEHGLQHQAEMPNVPRPEDLPGEADLAARFGEALPAPLRLYLARERPIELRPVDLGRYVRAPGRRTAAAGQQIWMRAAGPLPDDPAVHRAVLAYMSDMTLLDAVLVPHGRSLFDPGLQVASLDHALWFHRPARADDWLLYVQDSPSASGARGLARGGLFSRSGELVLSVAQEGLVRPTDLHRK